MNILDVKDLYKNYGNVIAVDGISFSIREGSCFGLLGPNGAGKSTTLEVIEGVIDATSGSIHFKGQPRGEGYKELIGIQFQSTGLQDYLRVGEALELFSGFYSKNRSIDEISERCGINDIMDRDHRRVSGGQRQRLLLAMGLVNDPELLFLDEPTTGLDPHARKSFWELIEDIKKEGKSIILTTHYMEEAYVLCDEIAIMNQGKIIAQGDPRALLKKHFQGMKFTFPQIMAKQFQGDFPWTVRSQRNRLEFLSDDVSKTIIELQKRQIDLSQMEVQTETLEDLFLDLTNEKDSRK